MLPCPISAAQILYSRLLAFCPKNSIRLEDYGSIKPYEARCQGKRKMEYNRSLFDREILISVTQIVNNNNSTVHLRQPFQKMMSCTAADKYVVHEVQRKSDQYKKLS